MTIVFLTLDSTKLERVRLCTRCSFGSNPPASAKLGSLAQLDRARRYEDRYFDLVRQKRAATVLHTFGRSRPNSRGLYFREGIHEHMPIPQNEIDMSNGVVEQNPGY